MGITVPTNVAKNLQSTASKSIYFDVPKDGQVRARFLPAVDGSDGEIWYHTANHYRFKTEDGEGKLTIGCNKIHGDGNCFLCDLADYLRNSDDKNERALGGEKRENIKAGHSWYAQVLPAIKTGENEDGTHIFEYGEMKLIRLPKSGAGDVNVIMKAQQGAGEPLFMDAKNGKDLVITRQDSGVAFTKYGAMPAGVPVNLKGIRPDWEKQIKSFDGVWDALNVRVLSNDEQLAAATRSYPDLDWSHIMKQIKG